MFSDNRKQSLGNLQFKSFCSKNINLRMKVIILTLVIYFNCIKSTIIILCEMTEHRTEGTVIILMNKWKLQQLHD